METIYTKRESLIKNIEKYYYFCKVKSSIMVKLEEIKKTIEKEINCFESEFKESFKASSELLNNINQYILNKRGKGIRPILTLLAAKAYGEINETTIKSAISLEMLHTASLIHDDVVDETLERRGQKSVNAVWNNKISILAGDYLLSQSILKIAETKSFDILSQITRLGKEVSEGELMQAENANSGKISEEKYFEVIKKKTACLFATCTYAGAKSVNANEEDIEKIKRFGEIYGICFQIRDDIFDYIGDEKEIGKPTGNDISEGKITLPLIYALNSCSKEEKEDKIKVINNKEFTPENIKKLIQFAIEKGGIKYAENKMDELKKEAYNTIKDIKNQEIRETLEKIINHTITRNK